MAPSIPTREPQELYVGATTRWRKSLSDFDPASATLSYAFVKSDGTEHFTVTATDNGDGSFLVTVAPSDLTGATAGDWRWQAWAEESGERTPVARGRITVRPDFAAGAVDERVEAEKILAAIESLLAGKFDKDASSYSIGTRSLTSYAPSELLELRNYYKAEVARLIREERIAQGLATSSKIRTRLL